MNKTIIIADDHPVTLRGMESILLTMGIEVIDTFNNGIHALNHIIQAEPDFALLDLQMPGLSGLDVVEEMNKRKLKTKSIIYTMHNDIALFERAKSLDVNGYLLKEFALEELKDCIAKLSVGNYWYSPKLEERLEQTELNFDPERFVQLSTIQKNILKLIADKKTTQEISKELFISVKTVESHRSKIIKTLGLDSTKNSLIIWAIENKGFFNLVD